jgi:2,5-dioxopentanoate dehydrogenase
MSVDIHPILVAGKWTRSSGSRSFRAVNPATGNELPGDFPISERADIEAMLIAADLAFRHLQDRSADDIAAFLNGFAGRLESEAASLAELAHLETGLAVKPRLLDVELPRTVNQLRVAAAAATDGGWSLPTIDSKLNIRSMHGPIGPVVVMGPNNFPFAYNGICGGDFAAAIAAGNPVIGKAHPHHPGTTARLAELAREAAANAGMPEGLVQLVFAMDSQLGIELVADRRVGAVGFTGSRAAGLALKRSADAAGKPIYLEMSSVNPVVLLPGAVATDQAAIVEQFCTSSLMAAGQFCTNPGLIFLVGSGASDALLQAVISRFASTTPATMLSRGVVDSLTQGVNELIKCGATRLTGGRPLPGERCAFEPTLLTVNASRFLDRPVELQREMFGTSTLFVVCQDTNQLTECVDRLEGNLTGSIYANASDQVAAATLIRSLRGRVGRLLMNKMPTGVAVTPAMNHGGPFPATGHPGFTAVGAPATLRRFSQLWCYDNVGQPFLPELLRDQNSRGTMRLIDSVWTTRDLI